jgi:hypothetical protein
MQAHGNVSASIAEAKAHVCGWLDSKRAKEKQKENESDTIDKLAKPALLKDRRSKFERFSPRTHSAVRI